MEGAQTQCQPGIVDQHVDPVPLGRKGCNHRFHLLFIPHIKPGSVDRNTIFLPK